MPTRKAMGDVSSMLDEQRSSFEALRRIVKEREHVSVRFDVGEATEFFDLIEAAVDAKGRLMRQVWSVVYPGVAD